MATTIKDLLTQAAVIRDAAAEGENTAMRVGSMFVDLVQRTVDTLSADALSALGLRVTAAADKVTVTYKTVDAGGTARDVSVTIPSATVTTAGVMSTAQLAAINKATQDITSLIQRLDGSDASVKAASDAAKSVADALAAHETVDATEHAAIRKEATDALASAVTAQHDTLACSGVVAFDGFVGDVAGESVRSAPIVRDPEGKMQQGAATVHYDTGNGCWAIKQDGQYYDAWDDDYLWQDAQQTPRSDKAYYNAKDGKLYRYSSADNQLHEIALTQLRDDIGILLCRVRTAAPLSPMEGKPTAKYTIWWSQTSKEFFAAVGYDEATVGDSIENCDSYKLSSCDEYNDYCTVSGSGQTQVVTPRTDRLYRDGNELWQYDASAAKMVRLGDVTGKDLSINNLECADATLGGDVEIVGMMEVGNGATVTGGITVAGGDIHVQGEAELGSVKTAGNIDSTGTVSGSVIHGDSATFCQGDEVKIDINGNISTEGMLTVQGGATFGELQADNIEVGEGGSMGVCEGAKFNTDNIGGVLLDGRIDYVFRGIRQALPTGYTAVTTSVKPTIYGDGDAYDIIYIRALKRFVAVNDTAMAYAERFNGETEYNVITNNKPTTARTDRTWRWNADTYKYDTEAYIKQYIGKGKDTYGADLVCVTDAGKALFIKMWREAMYRPMVGRTVYRNDSGAECNWYGACDDLGNCYAANSAKFQLDYGGYYPEWHETPGFFINGITGISYAEARQIYEMRTTCPYPRPLCETTAIRTNMMCDYVAYVGGGQDGRGINTMNAFSSYDVQVIRVAGGLRGQRPTGACWIRGALSFYNADSLEEVIGAVQVEKLGDTAFNSVFSPFKNKLQYLWITGLSVSLTKTFAAASNINIDCLRYLVEKSQATAAKPISVTLHADVFAALHADILTLAETKYVTFVSA